MTNKINNFSQYCLEVEGEPPSDESETQSDIGEDDEEADKYENFVFDTDLLQTYGKKQTSSMFITETLDEVDGAKVVMALANRAALHSITGEGANPNSLEISIRYGPNKFEGIVIDTGAAHYSTGGYDQWVALQRSK
ncbi:hypothetical protein K3495_g16829, partial [Podosphaera aphanis]